MNVKQIARARSVAVAALALLPLYTLLLGAPLFVACSTPANLRADGPQAECPVCKHNGDLACVCVHVATDTPSCACAGKTYYFCSDECKAEFLAHPERYTKK